MLAKWIAKRLVRATMTEAAMDERQDIVQLIKKPGSKGNGDFAVEISFSCPMDRIPLYVERIVESAAEATGAEFNKMLEYLKVEHELAQEISETKIIKEVRN